MKVTIDNDTALEMLIDRVKFWTDDETTIDLFSDYYENMIYDGCFDGCEFDVNLIVDNDYINYFRVLTRDELKEEYDEIEDDRIYATRGDYVLYYAA